MCFVIPLFYTELFLYASSRVCICGAKLRRCSLRELSKTKALLLRYCPFRMRKTLYALTAGWKFWHFHTILDTQWFCPFGAFMDDSCTQAHKHYWQISLQFWPIGVLQLSQELFANALNALGLSRSLLSISWTTFRRNDRLNLWLLQLL